MARLPAGYSKTKDGRIVSRFTIEKKRYAVYGKTVQECRDKEKAKRDAIAKGINDRAGNITLNEYFPEWLKSKRVKSATRVAYESQYRNNIAPMFGETKVKNITRRAILQWQAEKEGQGAKGSIAKARSILIQMFKAMQNEGIINNAAAICFDLPIVKEKAGKRAARDTIHRALTDEEIKAFLQTAKETSYYYNAIRFILLTGCRGGEAGALQWGDIDTARGIIHIRRTVTRNEKCKFIIGDTAKTASSIRDIPINAAIREILDEQRELARGLSGGNAIPIDGRIFTAARGGILNCNVLDATIRNVLRKMEKDGIDIEYFSIHSLRATFASMALKMGVAPNTTKELLGHSSLSMTMDLYGHVYEDEKREAMKKMGAM